MSSVNALGQPIGAPLADWRPPPRPTGQPLAGRYCQLERLVTERHAASLYAGNAVDSGGRDWTYLPYGPFATPEDYRLWMEGICSDHDPLFYAVIGHASRAALGVASYLRIMPDSGSIEIGHLKFSPHLQRTPVATEALYLLMKNAFELGYRRLEWKCDALHAPSRAAALRLGFAFEGIFRQATVVKGRNRDTAWYALLDRHWPALDQAFARWLDPANFDTLKEQRVALSAMTRELAVGNE